jgi:hypothetical protein
MKEKGRGQENVKRDERDGCKLRAKGQNGYTGSKYWHYS